MQLTKEELQQIIKEELEAVLDEKRKKKKKKKKKKSKGKKDACYHKVRSRYDVWPSAYASGALVKCRKVGAKNWGNSKKNESLNEEFEKHDMFDPKTGKKYVANVEKDHNDMAEKGYTHIDPKKIEQILRDEGGAAGMDPFLKEFGEEKEEEILKTLGGMPSVKKHEDGDYILDDNKEVNLESKKKINGLSSINEVSTVTIRKGSHKEHIVLDEKKARKKAGTESSKENSLRDWFKRKGAKGKKGGWVDCNAPDGKGGYKSCGRKKGEKRKKYPACRPTPGACKERGKGKSWGKKARKKGKKK